MESKIMGQQTRWADAFGAARTKDLGGGSLIASALENPRIDDLPDELGERVLQMLGQVHVVPTNRMPCTNGLAPI